MRRYLLLDDNRAFAENLAEILRDGGDEANVVTDAREAIAYVREVRYDVLLTDMRMPGMSGAEALQHLRRLDPGLAAIVVTAYPGEGDLEVARREGLLAVLPKPVPLPSLMSLLSCARRDGLVYVVEDDADLCENLMELLRARGFSCVSARSARAVEHLSEVRPFAALVDLRLPGEPDGAALRLLRSRYPDLPAFAMTAYPEALEDLPEPAPLFPKPFETRALLEALERTYAARQRQAP